MSMTEILSASSKSTSAHLSTTKTYNLSYWSGKVHSDLDDFQVSSGNIKSSYTIINSTFSYKPSCSKSGASVRERIKDMNGTTHYIGGESYTSVSTSGSLISSTITDYIDSIGRFQNIYIDFNNIPSLSKTQIQNITVTTNYLPYTLKRSVLEGKGSIYISPNTSSNTAVTLTAIPSTGYKFKSWSNGEITNSIVFNPTEIDTTHSISASFEPITYTVNYHTLINGIDTIISSQNDCIGNITYDCIPFPELNLEIPEGYALNPIGWTKNTSGNIRNNTDIIYSGTSNSTILTQYTSFTNLASASETEVNLYLTLFPKSYTVNYISYKQNTMDNPSISTVYRIYGTNDLTLKNLSASTGFKLTNQINPNTNQIDSTKTNYWFTSNENMEPGDETITLVSATFADDINLYSYEIPKQYIINYHTLDENANIISTQTKAYDYGTSYEYMALPNFEDIPIGYGVNPIGWIETIDGVIRFNTEIMYSKRYPSSSEVQRIGSFSNLSSTDMYEINLYAGLFPIQYLVNYTLYRYGGTSQYSSYSDYRYYNVDYPLRTLSKYTGYKLTNRMQEMGGPEDTSILKAWFISNENMEPGDETISSIDPTFTDNINLYSYETPINYKCIFHIMNAINEEISSETLDCVYGTSFTRPEAAENIEGHLLYGWYSGEQDISNWYVDPDTLNLINGINQHYNFNSTISSNFTTIDQSVFHNYAYYIPYGFNIKYLWLDNYGTDSDEFKLPSIFRKYGQGGDIPVEIIPSYPGKYIVDNEGTKNWYYYKNEGTDEEQLVINEQEFISETDLNNYVFYGQKHPLKRHITFSSQNEEFGSITVLNPTEDELYDEGYVIEVQANPTEIAYFSNWNDGNNSPNRTIIVGNSNMHYMGIFRSNQVYVGMLGILEGYKNISKIKAIIPPKKIVTPKNSYSVENLYTYGFYLNNNGYYESNNKKVSNSFAMCKVNITAGKACKMYVDCINYAESNYDYGMLSKINTTLSASSSADSSSYLQKNFYGLQYSYVQTVIYDIPAGNSYIYIKYRKDGSVDSNNDSLQFKIRFE